MGSPSVKGRIPPNPTGYFLVKKRVVGSASTRPKPTG